MCGALLCVLLIVLYQSSSTVENTVAAPRLIYSLHSSLNESVRSSSVSLPSNFNESLMSNINESLRSNIESLQPSLKVNSLQSSMTNETRHLLQILRKKGIVTNGGRSYEGRYKNFHNFTGSQIDSIITALGVPNLDSLNFKQQLLACTGLTFAKSKKPVNFTDEGNVVMPRHFQTCKNMSFQKTGKTVALLSFPGSGNSWVRQLIETTTGIYTGTYKDCDFSYISNGMIGEGVYTDNVIAIKIHFPFDNLKWLHEHNVIYVVRNPFDAIFAEWNRQKSASKNYKLAHISTTTIFGKYHVYTMQGY